MTDEEKQIIEYVKKLVKYYDKGVTLTYGAAENDCFRTLVEIIEKQQKEMEGYKTYTEIERANNKQISAEIEKYKRLAEINLNNEEEFRDNICEHRCLIKSDYEEQLEKKDKIIDLMCEQLAGLAIWSSNKDDTIILEDKEKVREYFEKEASSE